MTRVRLDGPDDWEWRRRGPSSQAVHAFGVRPDRMRRLPGGAGHVWTDDRLVVKPVGCVPEHAWVCSVYADWRADGVRVPEPVPAGPSDATVWSVDGWGAHVRAPGRDAALLDEAPIVRDACDAFHRAVRDLPRPGFLDDRLDPWAYGDRLAWEDEEPLADVPTRRVIDRLREQLAQVSSPSQPIHGDVLPNVLVHESLPPAVIDWPPYFRPAATARAIVVTDAVTFRGAPVSWLADWADGPDWRQLLLRALLYRLGPTGVFAQHDRLMGSLVTHLERVGRVVDAAIG